MVSDNHELANINPIFPVVIFKINNAKLRNIWELSDLEHTDNVRVTRSRSYYWNYIFWEISLSDGSKYVRIKGTFKHKIKTQRIQENKKFKYVRDKVRRNRSKSDIKHRIKRVFLMRINVFRLDIDSECWNIIFWKLRMEYKIIWTWNTDNTNGIKEINRSI